MAIKAVKLVASFSIEQAFQTWDLLNKACFEGRLLRPKIKLEANLLHCLQVFRPQATAEEAADLDGICMDDAHKPGPELVTLHMVNNLDAKKFMQVMAHEMVHQALAQDYGYMKMLQIGHDATFMSYRSNLARYKGLRLLDETGNDV